MDWDEHREGLARASMQSKNPCPPCAPRRHCGTPGHHGTRVQSDERAGGPADSPGPLQVKQASSERLASAPSHTLILCSLSSSARPPTCIPSPPPLTHSPRYLKQQEPDLLSRGGIVIGNDARHNSRLFALVTAAVFASQGVPVHLFPEVGCRGGREGRREKGER